MNATTVPYEDVPSRIMAHPATQTTTYPMLFTNPDSWGIMLPTKRDLNAVSYRLELISKKSSRAASVPL